MANPFKYRPGQGGEDPDVEDMEWADNWLSNFMAWASQQWPFEPACNTPEHWTSRIVDYFFTDCPCCLFIRGTIVGAFCIVALEVITFLLYVAFIAP